MAARGVVASLRCIRPRVVSRPLTALHSYVPHAARGSAARSSSSAASAGVSTGKPCVDVRLVPMFEDNYAYLVVDAARNTTIMVDPAEPAPVIDAVRKAVADGAPPLAAVLTTHKHWDHAGGNEEMAEVFPGIAIVGPQAEESEIPAITKAVGHNETFNVGDLPVRALHAPCHTRGHAMYLIAADAGGSGGSPVLFSGDTLFVGGCGRFFEGDAADMYSSLYLNVKDLPRTTLVYCGHEYTLSNLRFALSVDPSNAVVAAKLRAVEALRDAGRPSIPTTLESEFATNPFLRMHEAAVQAAVGMTGADAVDVLAELRRRKDSF